MNKPSSPQGSAVSANSHSDRVYLAVRELLVAFRIRPDERINESALARQLSTSRTPLREALNRLAAEGFLRLSEGRGFHCASFHPQGVLDLYELRQALEVEAVRLAGDRATPDQLVALREQIESGAEEYRAGTNTEQLLKHDELFHTQLVSLSANAELSRQLDLVNARIRFFRWVDLDGREGLNVDAHLCIVAALQAGDTESAVRLVRAHVERGQEEAAAAVGRAWSRMMMAGDKQA